MESHFVALNGLRTLYLEWYGLKLIEIHPSAEVNGLCHHIW